ncbi:aldehyde dehydrogenase [Phyllobacterium zundukense]|uniref:Aldehyde dehydrogenase PuuC n=1 Tax=Phyllobacterium zundukense TaxID=1867719 RepID=A0A2N9W0M6_9HYPH|nr:aldehyde dehydrogenase [Phyllobacterium zundukense]ATU95459.1 aldehyde dehydrogenase PuuC [Phyllobacterium zundukense]PIO45294.1 aldehyde dehydrogenase PuuC [Phyllobacterium zundukense]
MTSQPINWHGEAANLTFRNNAFIDGKFVSAQSGDVFDAINPANGKILTKVASCDVADVDIAVHSARKAFEAGVWSRRSPAERKKVLQRFAELMYKHADELALLETLNMGKPISDARSIDVPGSANTIAWYAEAIDKIYDEIAPTGHGALGMITREAVGVVAAVVPWNFPLLMACWKLGPSLAAGNSVILKPAEQSPLSALRLAELASEAGVPDGVFNVVTGLGETAGRALGLHMDVDIVTFTGSTEVGKLFMGYSGQSNLKRIALECGGKTPHIVMADCANLDEAATAAAFGIFFNQGEVCNAGSRLLVDRKIKDAFVEKVIAVGKTLIPGDPLDPQTKMGAIVSKNQLDRVLDYIEVGSKEGATLLSGGKQHLTETGGYFVEPTVFDGVTNSMRIAQEEIFGPVLATISFADTDEAVRIANDTIYGLAAAVWTDNIDTALSTARRLRAGSVWVNNFDESNITVPFGGYKQSGFGRDKSLHAIDKYTELKTTWIKIRA